MSLPGSATKPGPGRKELGDVPGEWLRLLVEHPTLGYNQISVEHPDLAAEAPDSLSEAGEG